MGPRARFALWLASACALVVALAAAGGAVLWADLGPTEREVLSGLLAGRVAIGVLLLFFLPFVFGAALQWLFARYPAAARRLAEELRLVRTVNPEHRVTPAGAAELRELAAEINRLADAHAALKGEVDARIEESNLRLGQEKNRLAALMSELAQSVLVCNAEGRILLYNARATQLLGPDAAGAVPVGLGRSIFGLLDKSAVVHALDKLRRRLEQGSADPVAHFVTARAGALLRGQMAPVLDAQGAVTGFVLLLEDITRSVEINSRRDVLLQQLTEGIRASLANIRAAAETVQQHPQMEPARRERFTEVIREEAQRLSLRLDQTLARGADTLRAPWPLEDMLAADLMFALQRNFEVGAGVTACPAESGEPLWLAVDSHSLVQALTHVMGRLRAGFGTRAVTIELAAEDRFALLTMRWTGPPIDPALLHDWEQQPISMGGDGQVATLKEVIERHGGELWCQSDRTSGANSLSVQLPLAPSEHAPTTHVSDAAQGRPVYYDFDLFSQPGQTPELDERELSALTYTVFDTETTGLSPSDGDEIISIGAVRIVNGRLLEQECFDRLVNPRRSVRKESQQVHGLTADVLADQPGIEDVLPSFHRFAEDTVLVAHNAAFDMRFLQLKEAATGIRFVQPVLDTLLLSALVHPGHVDADHTLERIAQRLGIPVMGRHTALGDAIVTGEVFLKLVPLLAERGIRTLGQAREASQKTLYAKLVY